MGAHTEFRDHNGITMGYAAHVEERAEELVRQAAAGVGWNQMGAPPSGFPMTLVDGKMRPIHPSTGIEFKPGFQMNQTDGSQKWEGNARSGNFRLDLQNIENNWANWAIQIGNDTVATCLMEVGKCFSQRHLVYALKQSASRGQLCELTMVD